MTWHQPLCEPCWYRERPTDEPHREPTGDVEICCKCGAETTAGIHVIYRPAAVDHPTED